MKRLFPGVRGRLADLIAPSQKQYKLAVAIGMGKNLDAVVVNSEATAFECISWLRENKVRVGFARVPRGRPRAPSRARTHLTCFYDDDGSRACTRTRAPCCAGAAHAVHPAGQHLVT